MHWTSAESQAVAEPADEQGHVRALAAPVGVQLVQDQEPQALGGLDQSPVPGTGEHKLEHHVVGQQDVGRIRDDPGPVVRGLLPGVTLERHRRALGIAHLEELLQLPELAVGQGVHRVDDDRLDPRPVGPRGLGCQDPVNDRDDVGQALPGPGPGGQHVAAAGASRLDGLALMLVQPQHRAVRVVVLEPEDPLALRLEQSLRPPAR